MKARRNPKGPTLKASALAMAALVGAVSISNRSSAADFFSFLVIGDRPYVDSDSDHPKPDAKGRLHNTYNRFSFLLDCAQGVIFECRRDQNDRFLVHVGDIIENYGRDQSAKTPLPPFTRAPGAISDPLVQRGGKCAQWYYWDIFKKLDNLGIPWAYTPGDNEWLDCYSAPDTNKVAFAASRLDLIRKIFFLSPEARRNLERLPELEQQSGLPENLQWRIDDAMMITTHVVSWEASGDRVEFTYREGKNIDWLRQAFSRAEKQGLKRMIVFGQVTPCANKLIEKDGHCPEGRFGEIDGARDYFKELQALAIGHPEIEVLYVHGDIHTYHGVVRVAGHSNLSVLSVPGHPDQTVQTDDMTDCFVEVSVLKWPATSPFQADRMCYLDGEGVVHPDVKGSAKTQAKAKRTRS